MIDKMTRPQLFEVLARSGRPVPPARTTRPVLLGLALYAYYLSFDEAMIENDARDLRNPDPPSRPLSYDVAETAAATVHRLSARLETVTERDALGVQYTHWRHAGTNVRLDTEPDGTYAVRVPQMDAPGYAIYADRVSTFVKARRHAGNAVALIREQVADAHSEAVREHRRRDADRAAAITLAPAAVAAAPSDTERIVRRAGYDVLRVITGHIDGWVETCKANAEAMGHRDLSHIHSWLTEDDFRTILADTARELGIGEQWEAGRS